jgi:hypothetical protein
MWRKNGLDTPPELITPSTGLGCIVRYTASGSGEVIRRHRGFPMDRIGYVSELRTRPCGRCGVHIMRAFSDGRHCRAHRVQEKLGSKPVNPPEQSWASRQSLDRFCRELTGASQYSLYRLCVGLDVYALNCDLTLRKSPWGAVPNEGRLALRKPSGDWETGPFSDNRWIEPNEPSWRTHQVFTALEALGARSSVQ